MPLFANPSLVKDLCAAIAEHIRSDVGDVDAIAGLEARGTQYPYNTQSHRNCLGFLFGPIVAVFLQDVVEIQKDALQAGWKVVLVDDLLATGGTLKVCFTTLRQFVDLKVSGFIRENYASNSGPTFLIAAVEVVGKAQAEVAEAFVLIELLPLRGRELISNVAVTSLLKYNEA
ncbi:unnamed protein product [Strongylus vulgaris]|uniref:adenine phosphoribosyltransferase n=1 Tax=Strongylus vulgaris TaxID=40348 RepID=A0A3P7KFG7_STRVU|nr:unnamed protein product [Strongylus vulgaris]